MKDNTPDTSLFQDLPLVKELGLRLAKEAGQLISEKRNSATLEISNKSEIDLVTSADMEAEQLILDGIFKAFPTHQVLSEETHPTLHEPENYHGPLWIIDPIDGTINFAHGLPIACVSIAFAFEGKVLFGVVELPFLGETYYALQGSGSYLNGAPINVSEVDIMNSALVAMGFPPNRREISGMLSKQVETFLQHCQDIRRAGSAAVDLCWVASGRMEFYFEDVNPWDIAAGALIVREAGGITGNYEATPDGSVLPKDLNSFRFIASNAKLFEEASALARKAAKES